MMAQSAETCCLFYVFLHVVREWFEKIHVQQIHVQQIHVQQMFHKRNSEICWGHAVAHYLRHCATSRKVAGSIPDGVITIFH
jgi:hypothetical protein